jgi:Na+-translocating ferredoxin:NAD+ oxidoreductase subunit B
MGEQTPTGTWDRQRRKGRAMREAAYGRLADALDRLPNGFPRTKSGVELRILERLCDPGEALLASFLTGTPEPVTAIAARCLRPVGEVRHALFALARRGIAWIAQEDGDVRFRLAPFIVGLYEARSDAMDHQLAHLVEEYLAGGGAKGILAPQPTIHRVVPAHATVKTEEILPYDDVRAMLAGKRTFHVEECICRLQKAQLEEPCPYPGRVCLSFSEREREARPGDLTESEALALLDLSETVGLVHTVSNIADGVGYVCNCCGCCCGILRGITEWGIATSVAAANYRAVIDEALCADCGTCIERCQVGAITEAMGCASVDLARCIGCGLCVSGCPNEVPRLERKPEAEIVHPPATFAEWERLRVDARSTPARRPARPGWWPGRCDRVSQPPGHAGRYPVEAGLGSAASGRSGEMADAAVLNTAEGSSLVWVRVPPSAPVSFAATWA